MCFKLLGSTSCAHIHLGNLLQDLHCVIPHLSDTPPTPRFDLLKHSRGNHLLCFLVSGTFQDPLFLSLPSTTLQANHNADSDNTGQSQRRFYRNTTVKRAQTNISFSVLIFTSILLLLWTVFCLSYQSYRSVSNQASWLLSIRSWVWPRSGNGSVWWPRSGRVSVW